MKRYGIVTVIVALFFSCKAGPDERLDRLCEGVWEFPDTVYYQYSQNDTVVFPVKIIGFRLDGTFEFKYKATLEDETTYWVTPLNPTGRYYFNPDEDFLKFEDSWSRYYFIDEWDGGLYMVRETAGQSGSPGYEQLPTIVHPADTETEIAWNEFIRLLPVTP